MNIETFTKMLDAGFYTGVPDSQLKALCDYLMDTRGIDPKRHIIAANEGNCVALAAGYYLATGKIPVVYLQNSGEGNIINPVASLLNDKVYAIPMIFIIGWRGEPGTKDEPQHIYQGEVTLQLLQDMDIAACVVGSQTNEVDICAAMEQFSVLLAQGKSVAFVIRKNALTYEKKPQYNNRYEILRERAIECVMQVAGNDPVICTTGKASRELFELRAAMGQSHAQDFLTVGSMGHSSSIALGIALQKPRTHVWCVDGDGAALMHMGALAVIGANKPKNLTHVLINNCAHETVGGMPTVSGSIDWCALAKACGYPHTVSVQDRALLPAALEQAKAVHALCLVEIKCAIGARADLGRPTTSALENRKNFEHYLESCL